MYFKIFYPVIFLLIIQISAFYIYNGFNLEVFFYTKIIVTLCYVSCFLSILWFSFLNRSAKYVKENDYINESKYKHIFDVIIIVVVIAFLVKPAVILYGLADELGFEYVRNNFFSNDALRITAFGNVQIAAFSLMYVVPMTWFYIINLIGRKDRYSNFLFYFLLLALILFNLSYAGRFYIYFSLIVIYIKSILEGQNIFVFLKKYLILILSLILTSLLMLNLRNSSNDVIDIEKDILGLIEYHIMQPFFFAQKIQDGTFLSNGYPFKTYIESFLFPMYFFVGKSFSDIPYGYYSNVFGEPTLYSFKTESTYNAFATFFAYLYSDFYFLTPIFVGVTTFFFLFYSKIIYNKNIRIKYVAYFSLMLYFGLFSAPILSPGALCILFVVPLFYRYKFKFFD
jgi:oligosaccharide repeat unit polymerase